MTTLAATTITVEVPISLCGQLLGKNQGRNWHWAKVQRAFDDQKQWAWACIQDMIATEQLDTDLWPYSEATMHIEWQYHTGRPPDDDNVVARLAGARDAFEAAGIVADDRHIRVGTVTFTRVPRGTDPMAIITLVRTDAEIGTMETYK